MPAALLCRFGMVAWRKKAAKPTNIQCNGEVRDVLLFRNLIPQASDQGKFFDNEIL